MLSVVIPHFEHSVAHGRRYGPRFEAQLKIGAVRIRSVLLQLSIFAGKLMI